MIQGHNLPMAVIGTLVLAFGWFGFNAGSTLAATDAQSRRSRPTPSVASAGGALTSLAYVWVQHDRPDVGMACNGFSAGSSRSPGPCAFVAPPAAVLIGVVAGLLVVKGTDVLEHRLRIDDPVGAIAVHGVCGAWGTLALGLLADGSYGEGWNGVAGPVRGLLFGDPGQLLRSSSWGDEQPGGHLRPLPVFFRGVERFHGNRVSAEAEMSGLDTAEIGAEAYHPGSLDESLRIGQTRSGSAPEEAGHSLRAR